MSDERIFKPLLCAYCKAPATTQVFENKWSPDYIYTCDKHETTAFS